LSFHFEDEDWEAWKTFNRVGDVLNFKGKITAIDDDFISVDQWVESERGITTTCRSVLSLK